MHSFIRFLLFQVLGGFSSSRFSLEPFSSLLRSNPSPLKVTYHFCSSSFFLSQAAPIQFLPSFPFINQFLLKPCPNPVLLSLMAFSLLPTTLGTFSILLHVHISKAFLELFLGRVQVSQSLQKVTPYETGHQTFT